MKQVLLEKHKWNFMERSNSSSSFRIRRSHPSPPRSWTPNVSVKPFGFLFLLIIIGVGFQSTTGLRFTISGFAFLLLATLIWKYPAIGVPATFAFLAMLGGVRRWLIPDFGWLAFDPLILIGAAISLLSFLPLLVGRKIPSDTLLSRYIKYLLIVMALQALNPIQGGLMVGLGGVLFYIAPLLWFYIGRSYGSEPILSNLLKISVFVYTLTAIYGLKQVVFGLSSSEQDWVKLGGYEALNVSSNAIRVFSTFASQQEYAITLSCAFSVCAALLIHRKIQYFPPLSILIPAMLLTAARGPIVSVLLAVCIQWAIFSKRRSTMLPRLVFALVVGIGGIVWSLSSVNTKSLSAGQADIVRHQQDGLLNPGESTGPGHLLLIANGIFYGFRQPLGTGLGSTTIAAGKLSGSTGSVSGVGYGEGDVASAESDVGNLFISLGLIGGIVYFIVIVLVFKQTSTLWRESRSPVFLALMGILVVCCGQWLSGGLYSLCFLIWFSIGAMDREFALQATTVNVPTSIPTRRGLTSERRLPIRGAASVRSHIRRLT